MDSAPTALRESVAKGYYKLLAYKDEYEVARLHLTSAAQVAETWEGDVKLSFHLAPPMLPGKDAEGRPKKREFGPWILKAFKALAAMRVLRGTPFDPFGYFPERRLERSMIRDYERDMREVIGNVTEATMPIAIELAELPLKVRGYGPVKDRAAAEAALRREELLSQFRSGGAPMLHAAE